jgi:hypothetical protein
MERLLKWLDDCDDLLAMARLQGGPLLVSLLLLAAFLVAVGAVLVLGPPILLAAQ